MSAKILAIDTATENCSVALLVNDQVISRSEVAPRDHTKKVLPMVDEVLKEAG
ncbi:tRNA (adenosine(37)-N6)-threonylcarbamoyltransferase complex dimerization subunit type 1 TsaB, partial [Vibrio sp. 811]|nr:tRNA (adenosine(37)-N6)-threonylcarbamoyltransferase complex dimerization subunit type 1 TsaB [Vibrio sp. 811]